MLFQGMCEDHQCLVKDDHQRTARIICLVRWINSGAAAAAADYSHRSTLYVDEDLRSSSSPFAYVILTYRPRGIRTRRRRLRLCREYVATLCVCVVFDAAFPSPPWTVRDIIILHQRTIKS